jgi:hypothetical protein
MHCTGNWCSTEIRLYDKNLVTHEGYDNLQLILFERFVIAISYVFEEEFIFENLCW